jgi:hypothetical protein
MDKNKWLKNLPMSGKNEMHMKHMKIPKKNLVACHKPFEANKIPFVDLNDLFEYNANTNGAT